MRIVFCDDEPTILAQLKKYVQEFFQSMGGIQPEIAAYDSGDLMIQNETRVDIAFLDVEMPGVSGIHVGAKLKELNPRVKIFIVTGYPDYLDEAMRFQVFRYLSKPIDKTRLFRNLKDAIYAYNIESHEYPILTNDGVFIRQAEEIVCVETQNRKVSILTTDGTFISNKNIDYWKETLSLPCFFVTHRSFVVNMRYVKSISKDMITLKYCGKEKIAFLSRRKYTQFKETYLVYLESTK